MVALEKQGVSFFVSRYIKEGINDDKNKGRTEGLY